MARFDPRESDSPGVAGRDAVVGARPAALEGVTTVHHTLPRDAEVPQPVVFLLHAGVGHARHSRPLLRETQVIRPTGSAAPGGLDRLRTAVMGASVSATER